MSSIHNDDQTQDTSHALSPTVVRLGIVSFLADVSSEMLYPITPIFLTTVLGASMASVGLIEGVAEAIASLLKVYSGAWSDRIRKRRRFIVAGYLLAAVAKPMIGISNSWLGVLGARALDRTGKGIRTAPRDALLAESVSSSNTGAAFGWHRAMDTMGAALGPLLAVLWLNFHPTDLRSLYFYAVIPGLLSVAVIFSVHERANSQPRLQQQKWQNPFRSWTLLRPDFKKYLLAWGIFSLANSSDVFLLMKAKSIGLSTTAVIFAYCAYNLVYAFSSPSLGRISDRIGRSKVLCYGLIVFALVYLGFGFARSSWHIWLLFIIYGLYMGATDGVGKAYAIDLSPKDLKATSIGILATITGLATIFASVIAGQLWDHIGPIAAFLFGSVGALIAAAIM